MKKLLITFGLLLLLIGSFYVTHKIQAPIKVSETKSSGARTTVQKNIIKPVTVAPTIPRTSSDITFPKTPHIYDILGTSSKPKI